MALFRFFLKTCQAGLGGTPIHCQALPLLLVLLKMKSLKMPSRSKAKIIGTLASHCFKLGLCNYLFLPTYFHCLLVFPPPEESLRYLTCKIPQSLLPLVRLLLLSLLYRFPSPILFFLFSLSNTTTNLQVPSSSTFQDPLPSLAQTCSFPLSSAHLLSLIP